MNVKHILIPVSIVLLPLLLCGTHNRAGEITYEQIGDLTIRATITTYTLKPVAFQRTEIPFNCFGVMAHITMVPRVKWKRVSSSERYKDQLLHCHPYVSRKSRHTPCR